METLERVESKIHMNWERGPISSLLTLAKREPVVIAFSLALGAICLDYAVAPALNTVNPALACGLLLLLLIRRLSRQNTSGQLPASYGISAGRALFFLVLHLAIITVVWKTSSLMPASPLSSSLREPAIAAAKYLVLLPTAFLLPWSGWRRFDRVYRAEWVAAALALFTLYPYRIFATAWPWYCQALGHVTHALARPFVSGLAYVPLPTPTLVGPNLDVRILFGCSGLEAIKLFQIVFVIMLVVDWTHLNKLRAFLAYFAGMAGMLVANVVRIALLAIAGNLAPHLAVQYALTAGWIFFACVAVAFIVPVYGWLVQRPATEVLATT